MLNSIGYFLGQGRFASQLHNRFDLDLLNFIWWLDTTASISLILVKNYQKKYWTSFVDDPQVRSLLNYAPSNRTKSYGLLVTPYPLIFSCTLWMSPWMLEKFRPLKNRTFWHTIYNVHVVHTLGAVHKWRNLLGKEGESSKVWVHFTSLVGVKNFEKIEWRRRLWTVPWIVVYL